MILSPQQELAIQRGQAVEITVGGAPCVLLRKDVYEKGESLDYSLWSDEEIGLLAGEAADLLKGDGFDESDLR